MKRLPATVTVTGLLLVLAVVAFAWVKLREGQKRAAAEEQLLADVAAEIGKGRPDAELSSLVTRIHAVAGYEDDRRFALALAQIERVRGHFQAAWDRLLAHATGGDATTAELREAALISLELHAHSGDRQAGRRAMDLAEHAYAGSQQPEDLLMAWQAAYRIGAEADRTRIAALAVEHAGSKEARLIARMEGTATGDLAELSAAFPVEPVEVTIARIVAMLRAGKSGDRGPRETAEDAVAEADRLCQRAPGIVDVRHFAATASLALAALTPAATAQGLRARAVNHLEWLLKNAPDDDARRPLWTQLLQGMGR